MEVEQLQLWARWLELQGDRVMAVMEFEKEEEATECVLGRGVHRRRIGC